MIRLVVVTWWVIFSSTLHADEVHELFDEYCTECHGIDRLDRMGPALLPQNLKLLKWDKASSVISNGSMASQMPAYADKLNNRQIRLLRDYITRLHVRQAPATKCQDDGYGIT